MNQHDNNPSAVITNDHPRRYPPASAAPSFAAGFAASGGIPCHFGALIGLVAVLTASPLQAGGHFWDEIPRSPSTSVPAVVVDDYWNSEFERVNREITSAADCKLVFFGDSITWSWSLGPATGREIWESEFRKYNPVNMGNSGDITPVMLYRVTHGNLDFPVGRHPKVAVLLCGINNFGVTQSAGGKEKWELGIDCPPEDIANGQRAIAQVFRRKLPGTRVIMMALLPVADSAKWEKCRRVNTINASLARDSNEVAYVNLQDSFLQPDGTIIRSLYADGIHLSKEGYQAWAKGIAPVLGEFMKAPPLAPVRIMLIGGSITEGSDSRTSYRRYLDGMLRKNGRLIDFVGSRHLHRGGLTQPDSYEFDTDHEGQWSKDSAWIADNIPGILTRNVPDVAVIELGSEDIASRNIAAEPLTEGIVRNINRVIESLRAANPKVKVVVANAVCRDGKEQAAILLNRKISLLARPASTGIAPIVLADIAHAVDLKQDMDESGDLPNANGARKIAAALAGAIQSLLPLSVTNQ